MADGRYDLQLGGTLIDIRDAGIPVDTFASVVFHETGTSVNLDSVVSVLVCVLGSHAFTHRGESIRELAVLLEFLTFFRSQFTFLGYIIQRFVDVNETGGLV